MTRENIELGNVTPHNIKQLKRLNSVVFPVSYNDKFYKDVLEAGELAKLAYYNDIVVGAVCCRIDISEKSRRLYIMTLGCLYPYRRLGIGTMMVQHVLDYVEQDGNFDSIFLSLQDWQSQIQGAACLSTKLVPCKPHHHQQPTMMMDVTLNLPPPGKSGASKHDTLRLLAYNLVSSVGCVEVACGV